MPLCHLCTLLLLSFVTLCAASASASASSGSSGAASLEHALFEALTQQTGESAAEVRQLVAQGADVHALTPGGESTLHRRREEGGGRREMAWLCIASHCDVLCCAVVLY